MNIIDVFKMEVAAQSWFHRLSPEQQQKYVQTHHTKFQVDPTPNVVHTGRNVGAKMTSLQHFGVVHDGKTDVDGIAHGLMKKDNLPHLHKTLQANGWHHVAERDGYGGNRDYYDHPNGGRLIAHQHAGQPYASIEAHSNGTGRSPRVDWKPPIHAHPRVKETYREGTRMQGLAREHQKKRDQAEQKENALDYAKHANLMHAFNKAKIAYRYAQHYHEQGKHDQADTKHQEANSLSREAENLLKAYKSRRSK